MLDLTLLFIGYTSVATAPFLLYLVHELFWGRYVLKGNKVTIEVCCLCLLAYLLHKSVNSGMPVLGIQKLVFLFQLFL